MEIAISKSNFSFNLLSPESITFSFQEIVTIVLVPNNNPLNFLFALLKAAIWNTWLICCNYFLK